MNIIELSNDQLVQIAPSIGATKPHEETSNRYSFVPTLDAVNHLRDNGWIPISAEQASTQYADREGYQKHLIRFTKPDLLFNGNRMDQLLYNSHDGASSFLQIGGIFRFVCANGVVIGDQFAEFSHTHINFDPDHFINASKLIHDHLTKVIDKIDQWRTIQLEKTEKEQFALAAHHLISAKPADSPLITEGLLIPRRSSDDKNNLWSVFNIIQENIIKGNIKGLNTKSNRKITTRKVKSLDRHRILNKSLWTITENMAKFKTAA